jgi:uncharacterized RDD family membrane protein YckC
MTDHHPDDPGAGERSDGSSPQPPSSPGSTVVGADLGVRFVARLIDGILLGIVDWFIFLIFIRGILSSDSGFGTSYTMGSLGFSTLVSGILTAAITIGYFTFMESTRGQTIGKMLLGLRTTAPDGGNPTTEEAFKRNLFYAIGIVPVIGGLAELAAVIYIAVTINSSATHQGWHDEFAGGTKVVRT